jgi:DNA-binding response OmpR family regulator
MIENCVKQGPPEQAERWRLTRAAILVVDDERLVRKALEATFARWGYSVDVAADGIEALGHLSRREYDVIITDRQMPSMDGISLWRRAMIAGHPGAWILMTGSAGPGLDCGMPILRKPFGLRELRAAIEGAQLIRGSAPGLLPER